MSLHGVVVVLLSGRSLCILVLLSLQGASSVPYCPTGWQPYRDFCYQLRGQTSFTARIWVSARADCRGPPNSGFLASIHSSGEQAFIAQLVGNTGNISNVQSVFIGFSSLTSKGGYAWSDGTAVSYTHWKPGFVTKQCISVETGTGNWNDRNCGDPSAYICKLRKLNSTVSPTQAPPTTVNVYCPNDWDQYGDRCYWYSNLNLATYSTASASCGARNGHLVSINSVYEQAYVLARLSGKGNMWLGLTDRVNEGEYVWTDGSDVTFSEWGFGEPNSQTDHEDCVELVASTGLWNDRLCTGTLSYMCEMAATQTTAPATPGTQCPSGWLSFNSHCYWFMATAHVNYTMAESYCMSQHSHLVHINDIYENAYVASRYPLVGGETSDQSRHFWIGINDMKTESVYTWTDGYPVEITSWRQGEPNDYNYQEDCTEFYVFPSSHLVNGLWNDLSCNRQLGLICERRPANAPATAAPQPTQPSPGSCTNGLIQFNNYCYKFDSPLRLTWPQAQLRCQRYGANLVSIHSMAEQNFVMQQAKQAGFNSVWIGLGDRNLEGGFVWSDGSPVQFTSWSRREPNNYLGQEDCVEANPAGSKSNWNDLTCGQLRYFACKIRVGEAVTMPTVTVPPYYNHSCPTTPSTYSHGPYCYTFVESKSTWSGASADCQKTYSGHLVSITSLDEEEFLANTVKAINDTDLTTHAWIGLNDQQKEGTFQWSDGSPIDFIYWNIGEPNNVASEDCVELVKGTYWNDILCSESFPYICKYPRPGVRIPPVQYLNVTIWGYCPTGWQTLGSYCYQANKNAMTWPDADKACRSAGGDLTSIVSAAESTFITRHVMNGGSDNAWIGLNDRDNEHTFVWTDGSPVLVVSWGQNQPNDFDGQKNCVYINRQQGRWSDESCGRKLPSVCKRPKLHYPSTAPPSLPPTYQARCDTTYSRCLQNSQGCQRLTCPGNCQQTLDAVYGWQIYSGDSSVCRAAVQSGLISNNAGTTMIDVLHVAGRGFYSSANENGVFSKSHGPSDTSFSFVLPSNLTCDPGWIPHNHACYLFVSSSTTTVQTWSEAESRCRSSGGYLAVISSAQEQAFVQSQLPAGAGQVWIGLNDIFQQGSFVWTDGTPLQFNVWGSSQPNNNQHTLNCVLMNPNGGHQAGTWSTARCDVRAGYICEKFIESTVPREFPTSSGACRSGWLSLGTSCYWATLPNCVGSDCFLSWSDARKACMSKIPGDLTSINSYGELLLAQYALPRLGWGDVWIGLNDQQNEGVYVWSDGSHVGEGGLDWAPGEPNDNNGTQNCVAMLQDGTITDQNCVQKFPYGCEIPLSAFKITTAPPSGTTQSSGIASGTNGGGLSSGAIVGIVIALVLVAAAVVVVLVVMKRRSGGGRYVARFSELANDSDDEDGLLGGPGGDETEE